jgi:formylmethanofuran dehydrogenase subunit B
VSPFLVCPRCGCACDDVEVVVEAGRVVEARGACEPGRRWLLAPRPEDEPAATVDGRAADAEEGVRAAARLLAAARRPLVWGLVRTSCEAVRPAVEIAERLRGVVDPAAGPRHHDAVAAYAEWGEVTTTLGEVALQRGLVVLWLVDPEETHPRLLERLGTARDASRVVRVRSGADAAGADPGGAGGGSGDVTVPARREVEVLWLLRELARRREPDGKSARGPAPDPADPAVALAARLLDRIAAAPYVAWVFDAGADAAQQHAVRAAAATLNAVSRVRLVPLRGGGNRVGAEAVLTWQTGFPTAVDFAAGWPRSLGRETGAARLLESGAVDAALVVAADPAQVPDEPVLARLGELPLVVLDSEPNSLDGRARVRLRSAPGGLASGGTIFRMDGVALGLRPAVRSRRPDEETWLRGILGALRERRA